MPWNHHISVIKRGVYGIVLCFLLVCGYGCSIPNLDLSNKSLPDFDLDIPIIGDFSDAIEEVSPPQIIQNLKAELSDSTPSVEILEPQENMTLSNQNVEIKLSVSGLKLYRDSDLNLGPHIRLALDNQPPLEIHNLNQPLQFKDLAPGTHTIRAIAEYPWHESFKNPSAYAQRSFNILTPSNKNAAGTSPVLTVSSIQDTYTTEPILLDFIVRQATASSNNGTEAKINKPKTVEVQATLNDQSFVIQDADASLYLEGIKNGQNWLKLELKDPQGHLAPGPFSEQTFGFQFLPTQSSAIGKIFGEEISVQDAGGIVGHPKPIVPPAPVKVVPEKVIPTTPSKPLRAPESASSSSAPPKAAISSQPHAPVNLAAPDKVGSTPTQTKPVPEPETKPAPLPTTSPSPSQNTPSKTSPFSAPAQNTSKSSKVIAPKVKPQNELVPPITTRTKSSESQKSTQALKTPPSSSQHKTSDSTSSSPIKAPKEHQSPQGEDKSDQEQPLDKAETPKKQLQSSRETNPNKAKQDLQHWRESLQKTVSRTGEKAKEALSRSNVNPTDSSSPSKTLPTPSGDLDKSAEITKKTPIK